MTLPDPQVALLELAQNTRLTCHEMNQRLQTIAGYAEFFLLEFKSGDEKHDWAREIKSKTLELINLTQGLSQQAKSGAITSASFAPRFRLSKALEQEQQQASQPPLPSQQNQAPSGGDH